MTISTVIAASNFFAPTESYSSSQVESLLAKVYDELRLPYGRLEELTGVNTRGCYPTSLSPGEIAALSAKELLQQNDLSDVDVLIYCGVCRDALEPSTSSQVHKILNLNASCLHFDLSNACLGMINAVQVAHHLLQNESFNRVLVVTGENPKPMLEKLVERLNNTEINRQSIKEHIASLTLGGASFSLLVSKEKLYPTATKILGFHWKTDTDGFDLCRASGDYWAPQMRTDSEKLLNAGIKLGKDLWSTWCEQKKVKLNYYVTHQVGKAHATAIEKELGLKSLKTWHSYPTYGNTGTAAVPLTWHLAKMRGDISSEMQGVWMGIGSGLNAMLIHVQG